MSHFCFSKLTFSTCFVLSLLALSGCSDQAKKQQEEAERHAKSADAYTDQGQYRAAISEYNLALKQAPSAEYATALGELYLELNQPQTTLNLLMPLSEQFSTITNATIVKAYLQKKKFSSALELLETLPSNTPEQNKNKQFMISQALLGKKQTTKGLEAIDNYEENFGVDANSLLLRLNAAFQLNDNTTAQNLQNALKQDFSHNAKVNNTLGEIALRSNNLDQAETYFTAALSQLPKTDVMTSEKLLVLTRLSDTLTQKGRFTEAMIYSQLIAEARPDFEGSKKELSQAINQIRHGNYLDAQKILNDLASRYPNTDRIQSLLGLVKLQLGDINAANLLLEKSVDPETASPALLRAAAQAQLQLSKPQNAVNLLEEALKQDPDNPQLLALYGLSASRVPELEQQSELALQKAVSHQPDNQRLRLALAQIYFRQGKSALGLSQLKIAANKSGSDPAIASAYTKALLVHKQQETARSYTQKLQNQYPELAHPWQLGAGIAQQRGDISQAEKMLLKAETIAPNNTATLISQAFLLQSQAQYQKAQDKYQQILQHNPTQAAALTGLLATSIKLKNQAEITQQLTELSSKGNQNALASLAKLDLLSKDYDAANQKSQQLANLPKKLTTFSRQTGTEIERRLAQISANGKNLDDAINHLYQALAFSPGSNQLLAEIAELQYAHNKPDDAKNTLEQLRTRQGGASRAVVVEATAISVSSPEQALKILRESAQKTKNLEVTVLLYKLEKQHDPASSFNTLEQWQSDFPADIRPLLEQANSSMQNHKNSDAAHWYEKVLAIQPTNLLALNNLSWLYGEDNQLEKAIRLGEKAILLAPNNANILDTLGWNYHKAGDSRATPTLEKALAASPNNAEIIKHLEATKR